MRRLIQLALLAGAVYLAYTQGLPYLKERLDLGPAGATEAEAEAADAARRCVGLARVAAEAVSDQLHRFSRPPVDRAMWSTALVHAAGELTTADAACRCGEAACRSASRALTAARKLLDQFDRAVGGDGAGFLNPATYREEIDRHLDNAEALLP